MSALSEHFFEDSPISRMAVGNVLYLCLLLTYSHEFTRNNTTPIRKREAEPESIEKQFDNLFSNISNIKMEECFERIPPIILTACNTTNAFELPECDRFLNNGMWDLCQSLVDVERCNLISYEYSTDDYFRHPAFWGGSGFLIGIILSLIAIIFGSCICAMCCKSKQAQKGIASGSGSASVEKGKGSKVTSSDTKNSSDDKNGGKATTVKPSVPQSQYFGDQFPADGGKKSVFIGAKTTQQPVDRTIAKNQTMAKGVDKTVAKPVNKTIAKSVRDNKKKRKNKYGKDVGALTAMEVTMYK